MGFERSQVSKRISSASNPWVSGDLDPSLVVEILASSPCPISSPWQASPLEASRLEPGSEETEIYIVNISHEVTWTCFYIADFYLQTMDLSPSTFYRGFCRYAKFRHRMSCFCREHIQSCCMQGSLFWSSWYLTLQSFVTRFLRQILLIVK